MNCGDIDWVSMNAPGDNIQDTLLNFAIEHGYCQLVSEPTREAKILVFVMYMYMNDSTTVTIIK